MNTIFMLRIPTWLKITTGTLLLFSFGTLQQPSLYKVFEKDFLVGTALNTRQILAQDAREAEIINSQFNAYTPENAMKSVNIHPEWDRYDFRLADSLVNLANRQGKKVNGHTLIWHNQLSPFARQIQDADSFRSFFKSHISTIADRYKDRIFSWDVVNEALNEDGTMRRSVFLEKLGEEYVTEAFRLTQAAAPHVELYYNDYNNEQPAKRKGCIRLINKIKEAGVRIDGVGIQGHWHLGKLPLKDIEESIIAYHALGLKVMITELDIEVLPRNVEGADPSTRLSADPAINPYVNGLPEQLLQQQAHDYAALFQLLLKHRDKISRVTFWGVHDGQTWLNNWPVRGRTNHPLLFDRQLQPKPAYHSLLKLKP